MNKTEAEMISDMIGNFVVGLFYLLQSIVTGAVRFVVTLLGPGLTVALVALVAALWWFGFL